MFSEKDINQIVAHGLSVEAVLGQIEQFRTGFPYLRVIRPASVGDGIAQFSTSELERLSEIYARLSDGLRICKFVPASGAATRMFKDLYSFLSDGVSNDVSDRFLSGWRRMAFADALSAVLPADACDRDIVSALLDSDGLGYGSKPKGMLLFHSYGDASRTALEEHLAEGAQYACADGTVRIHFTVSPEHLEGFRKMAQDAAVRMGAARGVSYDISFSVQNSSTDTVAVDMNGEPFRNDDGTLLFRPAGHGALLENLSAVDADIIFIKNIDNVTVESRRSDTVLYKRALAGLLLSLQREAFALISDVDSGKADAAALSAFVTDRLCHALPDGWRDWSEERLAAECRAVLDRPFRVCGMVRNLGEPGGGPFWAVNADGSVSLQIAESTQISPDDAGLMRSSTHFNPVDIVLSARRWDGTRHDLSGFVDRSTGFISSKSKSGRELRALELPGLWNGSMSMWNTVFVEVPVSTFTPVKKVTDLLRDEHQC